MDELEINRRNWATNTSSSLNSQSYRRTTSKYSRVRLEGNFRSLTIVV